jgi:hypothetical protein
VRATAIAALAVALLAARAAGADEARAYVLRWRPWTLPPPLVFKGTTAFDRLVLVEATRAFDASAGFSSAVVVHGRSAIPLSSALRDFVPEVVLDGRAGVTSDGDPIYDLGMMAGLNVTAMGVYSGLVASAAGDAIPPAPTVPVELRIILPWGHEGAVMGWVRSSYVLGEETRQDGAPNALFFADELTVGLVVRAGGGLRGWYAGAIYREQVKAQLVGALAGLAL